MSPADELNATALRQALGNQLIGNDVIVLEATTSTNDVVAQIASRHAEGLVVIAEQQTAGRGQYGRRWDSAAHRGLWLTVLLRPAIPVSESARITDLLAQTIGSTIAETLRLAPRIKPPNDIYIDGRKVAGVLVDMRVEANGSYCAVAGIGINVNHALSEFAPELQQTAGSLAMAAGKNLNRLDLAIALLRRLDGAYAALRRANAVSETTATRAAF